MTVKELYEAIGGSYDTIMSRLKTEDRVEKYLKLFLEDESFELLQKNLEQGDAKEAFRAAHNLKGVCQNMAFDTLYEISSEITELLREEQLEAAKEQMPGLTEIYEGLIRYIWNCYA